MPWHLLHPPHFSDAARAGVDATVVSLALPAVMLPDVSGLVQVLGAMALLVTACARVVEAVRTFRESEHERRNQLKDPPDKS